MMLGNMDLKKSSKRGRPKAKRGKKSKKKSEDDTDEEEELVEDDKEEERLNSIRNRLPPEKPISDVCINHFSCVLHGL